jgi:quinolinate synthase
VSPDAADRARRLLARAAALPRLGEADRVAANRVMGCVAQVWLVGRCDGAGRMRFAADSDSELSRGYCACLVSALDGARPEEVLDVDPADLAPLGGAAAGTGARSRASTWHNVLIGMQKRARAAIAAREGRPAGEPFPSLIIGRDGAIRAQGTYAEAQVIFCSFVYYVHSVAFIGYSFRSLYFIPVYCHVPCSPSFVQASLRKG